MLLLAQLLLVRLPEARLVIALGEAISVRDSAKAARPLNRPQRRRIVDVLSEVGPSEALALRQRRGRCALVDCRGRLSPELEAAVAHSSRVGSHRPGVRTERSRVGAVLSRGPTAARQFVLPARREVR